jgi:hypothetical protein
MIDSRYEKHVLPPVVLGYRSSSATFFSAFLKPHCSIAKHSTTERSYWCLRHRGCFVKSRLGQQATKCESAIILMATSCFARFSARIWYVCTNVIMIRHKHVTLARLSARASLESSGLPPGCLRVASRLPPRCLRVPSTRCTNRVPSLLAGVRMSLFFLLPSFISTSRTSTSQSNNHYHPFKILK